MLFRSHTRARAPTPASSASTRQTREFPTCGEARGTGDGGRVRSAQTRAPSAVSGRALALPDIQAALLGAFVWLVCLPKPELPADPDRRSMEVRWQVTGQEDRVETVYYGEPVTLPESVDAEGYTFLGWLDADGRLEEHRSIPVYRDKIGRAHV